MNDPDAPHFAARYVNMASPKLGAEVTFATDDFFAAKERLISDSAPSFDPDLYDDHGKYMDGWESRRRRGCGNDHCLIKLGTAAIIKGLCIDTPHFTGNFPPSASVEGVYSVEAPDDSADWRTLAASIALKGDGQCYVGVKEPQAVNWIRLSIFPDGGVARLRVYGEAYRDWSSVSPDKPLELSSLLNGARIIEYSDAHYGSLWSLLAPGRAENMGDGWETRRRRTPGNDWIIIELGAAGCLDEVEIDTSFFKGNFPDQFSLHGANLGDVPADTVAAQSMFWPEIIPPTKLRADSRATFQVPEQWTSESVTHLRLNIFPDGGVARFRAFGRPAK